MAATNMHSIGYGGDMSDDDMRIYSACGSNGDGSGPDEMETQLNIAAGSAASQFNTADSGTPMSSNARCVRLTPENVLLRHELGMECEERITLTEQLSVMFSVYTDGFVDLELHDSRVSSVEVFVKDGKSIIGAGGQLFVACWASVLGILHSSTIAGESTFLRGSSDHPGKNGLRGTRELCISGMVSLFLYFIATTVNLLTHYGEPTMQICMAILVRAL
ncbi:hypothetical protein C2845_PM15G00650 [Panicum miliaceum]|uniref:Uncharacterized protein n=1 Tax=Panicum miliaceum TaxID=4540 RepID=A0A3L6Q7W9_PANMI|nr:hypothetical protein C2845_PM15G00650 [Panicum miliaceum]